MPTTASALYTGLPVKTGCTAALFAASGGIFKDLAKTQAATTAGDAVFVVADQSGNGRDLTAVNESGSYNTPTLVTSGPGGEYAINATAAPAFGNRTQHLQMSGSNAAGLQTGTDYTVILVGSISNNTLAFFAAKGSGRGSILASGTAIVSGLFPSNFGSSGLAIGAAHIYVDAFSHTGYPSSQASDGDEYSEGDGTPTLRHGYAIQGDWSGSNPLNVFSNDAQGNNGAYGNISALLFFNRKLSISEVASVRAYLATVYSVSVSSAALPAESAAIQLVFDGDSITFGQGSTLPGSPSLGGWVPKLGAALNSANSANYRVINLGIPGQQADGIQGAASARTDPHITGFGGLSIYSLFAGTNDFAFSPSATPANVYAKIVSICQARQSLGAKVIVWTMLPRAPGSTANGIDGATLEPNRIALNTMIRNNWATFADGLVDAGNDSLMGQAGQYTNSYYADGVHPSDTGHSRLSTIAQPSYQSFMGTPVPPTATPTITITNSGASVTVTVSPPPPGATTVFKRSGVTTAFTGTNTYTETVALNGSQSQPYYSAYYTNVAGNGPSSANASPFTGGGSTISGSFTLNLSL